MAEGKEATRSPSPSILFQNDTRTVVLIDVPRSIEEAQVLASKLRHDGTTVLKTLVSSKPLAHPFSTPEPQHANSHIADSVSDLMSAAAVVDALEVLRTSHTGPWCLPRITVSAQTEIVLEGPQRKRHNSLDKEGASQEVGKLMMPEASAHLHGTILSQRERFLEEAPTFDLIVLDPPWPNRSARRKTNSYRTASNLDEIRGTLSLIPISTHLAKDGLVAVWITNKPSVATLLTGPQGLIAEWGLELVDEWTWVKVTTAGEPMVDLDSSWRKPWERLLIARRRGSKTALPNRGKVMVSVPDLHSRKPNLRGMFDGLFPPDYRGLEIFARNLTAGWWSWGDEVLKFQQPEHWKSPV